MNRDWKVQDEQLEKLDSLLVDPSQLINHRNDEAIDYLFYIIDLWE